MANDTQRPVRRSRAYRLLLWLFPRDIRLAYGEEMEAPFASQCEGVRGAARGRLWLRAIVDAVRHGLGERFDRRRLRTRLQMNPRTLGQWQPSRWWMDILGYDLRHALRMIARQPGMAATIVLTLALGIGANTAVFAVVHAVLLRPLPYSDPNRLVMIWEKRPAEGVSNNVVSPGDYLDWARMSTSFSSIAAYSGGTADLTGVGEPVQLPIANVSTSFFDVFGVRPVLGRTFGSGEDIVGRHRVIVVSYGLWQRRFGSDPGIVGRNVSLNDIPHEIIGVLPREFEFPGETADIWAPLVLQGGEQPAPRAEHFLNVYARLQPNATLHSARADMDRIGQNLQETYPNVNRGHSPNVVPLREEIVRPARGGLLVVMSAVAFLLLIACTNVANLLLAHGVGRRREMAIRSAVGAGRTRLLRQTFSESLVLAGLGGLLGIVVAQWVLQLLVLETPPMLRGAGLERARLGSLVLLFTSVICVIVGLVAGAAPAWHVSHEAPGDPLREGERSPVSLRRGMRFALIAGEVTLTAFLLVGAGLMLRSFIRVLSQPPGLETANRLTVMLTLPRSRYPDPDAVRRARQTFDERFNSIPGVIAAGASNILPLTGADSRRGVGIEGFERREGDPPTRAHIRIVTPRYFDALAITLKAGRGFGSTDDGRAPMVVVINDTMARRYWPGQSPIGRRVRLGGEELWREVVGIIGDVRHWGLDREVNPEMYLPHDQLPAGVLRYVLHTSRDPIAFVPAVAAHVTAVDPDLPMGTVRTMEDIAAKSVGARRWSATLLGMFAFIGLALAGAGIYGVMAHLVSMRTSEIGIRMTLGARPSRVLRQILSEALVQTCIGLAVGLALAFAGMRALQSMLFEVTAADPMTFAATAIMVVVVALLAAVVPARRAMRVDPVHALRAE